MHLKPLFKAGLSSWTGNIIFIIIIIFIKMANSAIAPALGQPWAKAPPRSAHLIPTTTSQGWVPTVTPTLQMGTLRLKAT